MPKFSKRSLEKLETCHVDLIKVAKTAIIDCPIDFGIAEGHRTLATQQKYFNEGKSKCDGIIHKSRHQSMPSIAFDFYAYVDGKGSWNKEHLTVIAHWILDKAKELDIDLEWGGDWKSFIDMPHIQLKLK